MTVAHHQTSPLTAATAPTGNGPVGAVGPALAVLLVVVGAAGVREGLITAGMAGGSPLLPGLLDTADRVLADHAAPSGAIAILAGLWLVVTALRPRVRRTVALRARTGVFVSRRDVARIASDAATGVSGVLHARSTVSRRRVTTTVDTLGSDPGPAEEVQQVITDRLRRLTSEPAVRVRTRPARPGTDGRIA